jgi:hypothetical protein
MRRVWLSIVSVLALAGCDTLAATRYSINADNVVNLRQYNGGSVNVGSFTSATPGQSEIMCRAAGPIKTPDGEPFSEYVKKALLDEMKIAGIYNQNAPITLSGRLEQTELNSVSGKWILVLSVTSSTGGSLTESEAFNFTTSFAAIVACREAATAFMPAVQNLIGRIIRNPEFRRLMGT